MRITLALTIALAAAAAAPAQPFEPDEHTLLLANFDATTRRADYAIGPSIFSGNGATLIDGYYGQAIDLRARGLFPDFLHQCDDYTPRYDGWGFTARGNVSPWQGTFECWFRPGDPSQPRLLWSNNFLGAELSYNVKHPGRNRYVGFGMTLNKHALRYLIPTVAQHIFEGEIVFRNIEGFGRPLDPSEWHHFAMTWSQGELVVYIDGRALFALDMTDQLGVVLVDNPARYLNMSDCIVDELRVSNVVRYTSDFEPRWRDGERPFYAFTGNPAVQRFDPKLIDAPTVHAPAATDPRLPGELSLLRGLERRLLDAVETQRLPADNDRVRFLQRFEGDIVAEHELSDPQGSVWTVTLTNQGGEEAWLEVLLGVEVPQKVDEFFDGLEPRRAIHLPRHRDEYCSSLPFAAASGEGQFVGVGISPRIDMSDIVTQWLPPQGDRSAVIRQGTKVALSPGESFTYAFHIVRGRAEFGTLDAIAAWHDRFPDLYRLLPDVPTYSYMPMTQYYVASKEVDFKRMGYAGNFWGHGPGHDKGDEFGTPEWWDNPAFDSDPHYFSYTRRIERMWGSIANVRQFITLYFRRSYDNWYPKRRFHTCPDLTPLYMIEALWPGYVPNEDPLSFGQYYTPANSFGAAIVNEYHTPLGAHFRQQARNFYRQTFGYCHGFINDMSHAGSIFRHNDPIAQKTPGRSFARDMGPFVRKALGRKQRYEELNQVVDHGHRMGYWSDGGSFSYTLGAYSTGIAIEGAGMYMGLTGQTKYVIPARHLIGEKPLSTMTHTNDDWIGYYLKPDDFTPRTLRDYYRYSGRQLILYCLEHGITLDPSSYMMGRQYELEMTPLMVEAAVLGRKLVPAARVNEPLWIRRSGENLSTLLVVGNSKPHAIGTDVTVSGRYFDGKPIFAPYFGGEASQRVEDGVVIEKVSVPPRDVAAFRAVAMLRTAHGAQAQVTARLAGDGITLDLELDMTLGADVELQLTDFGALYATDTPRLRLGAGRHQVRVSYRNKALQFTAQQWEQVELIRDNRANFCLVADPGVTYVVDPAMPQQTFDIGFERGTANMLNEFLEQYDEENGVYGDSDRGAFVSERPADYPGWAVVLKQSPEALTGRVRIDDAYRTIYVEGQTQGEMRRAMVVLMRMVDRKYPHVGRFHPMSDRKAKYDHDKPVPFDKWVLRPKTREFFMAFEDQKFLAKPVLDEQYEDLYANDNMDFAGRYAMMFPPNIVEPTYADDYVYDYAGPGKAYTREELHRRPRPEPEPKP